MAVNYKMPQESYDALTDQQKTWYHTTLPMVMFGAGMHTLKTEEDVREFASRILQEKMLNTDKTLDELVDYLMPYIGVTTNVIQVPRPVFDAKMKGTDIAEDDLVEAVVDSVAQYYINNPGEEVDDDFLWDEIADKIDEYSKGSLEYDELEALIEKHHMLAAVETEIQMANLPKDTESSNKQASKWLKSNKE